MKLNIEVEQEPLGLSIPRVRIVVDGKPIGRVLACQLTVGIDGMPKLVLIGDVEKLYEQHPELKKLSWCTVLKPSIDSNKSRLRTDQENQSNTPKSDRVYPRKLTYCSFATREKCLGVLLIEGDLNEVQAAYIAHAYKRNPGGELITMIITETDGDLPNGMFDIMWANKDRLIPPEEARTLFDAKSIAELDKEVVLDYTQNQMAVRTPKKD